MPIELRRQRDGKFRKHWYARYQFGGQKHFINLRVKVTGTPPESGSLKDRGDDLFEQSRHKAQAKLDTYLDELGSKQNATHLLEKIFESTTGEEVSSVLLKDLAEEWKKIPRRHELDEQYADQCKSTLERFADFAKENNSVAREIAHITRSFARSFMDHEAGRGVTSKTWNDTLKLLRATFKYLLPAGAINPFSGMPTKETETVFRVPFTPEELGKIIKTAKGDDFIRPIIVTGICTAMRRGDCCLLRWEDVDMDRRFLAVKTSKTGQMVSIPIFPPLYEELSGLAKRQGQSSNGYVFPEQAEMYLENPDGITWRVKKVLAVALGENVENATANAGPKLIELSEEEAKRRGLAYIAGLQNPEKRERMRTVFELYMGKVSLRTLAKMANVSKGTVSGYLNEIEAQTGCKVIRGRQEGLSVAAMVKRDTKLLRMKRKGGSRDASLRDFHSFRVTWVTIALTGGVPLELVKKVTGHKTTEVVMKHYFQPGREAFRLALEKALPRMLTYGPEKAESVTPQDEAQKLIEGMKGSKANKARLLELLGKKEGTL